MHVQLYYSCSPLVVGDDQYLFSKYSIGSANTFPL